MKSTRLIAFLGRAESGKDTACNYFVDNFSAEKRFFAYKLKDVCAQTFGRAYGLPARVWYGSQEDKIQDLTQYGLPGWSGRTIAQHIGTEGFRTVAPGIWTDHTKDSILDAWMIDPRQLIVISDLRFENEADAVRDLGGVVVRLTRNTSKNDNVGIKDHISEMGVDLIEADFVIDNDNMTLVEYINSLKDLSKSLGIS